MKRYFTLLLILFMCAAYQQTYAQREGQALVDSLLNRLTSAKEDTHKLNILNMLSFSYYVINTGEGIRFGQQQFDLAKKLGAKKGMAAAYWNISTNYAAQSNYNMAIEYAMRSLKIREETGEKIAIESSLGGIGTIYFFQSNYPMALDYYYKALTIAEEIKDTVGIAANLGNIGMIYDKQANYAKALEYFFRALKINEAMNNNTYVTNNLMNIATAYFESGKYDSSFDFFSRAQKRYKDDGNLLGAAMCTGSLGTVYQQQKKYRAALDQFFTALTMNRLLGNLAEVINNLGNIGICYLGIVTDTGSIVKPDDLIPAGGTNILRKGLIYTDSAVTLAKENGAIESLMTFSKPLSSIQKMLGNYPGALKSYEEYTAAKDSLFNMEKNIKLSNLETQRETDLKNKEIEINKLKVIQKRKTNIYLSGGIVALLIVVGFVVKERRKSEKLLLNILPSEVATELKRKGYADAQHFEEVTVLFTDFVSFTKVSERLTPQELVNELNVCFKAFDHIMGTHRIEKIKTVGDAYLAVCGLPKANSEHAVNIVNAAKEISAFMAKRKEELGDRTFGIRLGVHSGNVVAGIVGVKKFAYDIWGDTVNTAARMEQNSEDGKINISQATYELVKDKFDCTYRGEIDAKNKGVLMMYFVG